MREGGKRLVVAPPGPMQRQGVKSLTWVANLLDAIDEAGGEEEEAGGGWVLRGVAGVTRTVDRQNLCWQ
jgi:hypothetical protein